MTMEDPLTRFVTSFIDELRSQGVQHVIVSPGSRSTPLALAAADHPELQVWVQIDERSAGFFALGIAKASGIPVALICTSGTAAANYFPAIIEARYARIPLIVLTSDRPHELREVGAPQAMDQLQLYGHHVKWFHEMPLPSDLLESASFVRTVAKRSVQHAWNEPRGVVHLNFPFREPLVPSLSEEIWTKQLSARLQPYVPSIKTLTTAEWTKLTRQIEQHPIGLMICGPMHPHVACAEIIQLAERLGYLILADPLSQLRGQFSSHPLVIETYDLMFKHSALAKKLHPQLIIRIGAMPVSKSLYQWLLSLNHTVQMIVDEGEGWRDPTLRADFMVYSDISAFCHHIMHYLDDSFHSYSDASLAWRTSWRKIDDTIRQVLLHEPLQIQNEGHVFRAIREQLPTQTGLFVGNSMAIRDCDTYFIASSTDVSIYCNRGVNGIDGVISSALGVAISHPHTVLILGDLSALHDMNGWLLARKYAISMVIIIVNNDGGGIFSFLPQAQHPKHFESLFGTPHGIAFESVAALYGAHYTDIQSISELQDQLVAGLNQGGIHILEVKTERESNVTYRRELVKLVHQTLNPLIDEEFGDDHSNP
jgi:2-succinyl-5-enolpyruvyl-6-hydroxy-3-cyclohexene-1-carboxylate synthase